MPQRKTVFQTGNIYHIYNRGVEKRTIFTSRKDFLQFLKAIFYYQQTNPGIKLSLSNYEVEKRKPPFNFEILTYTLMPNHFHLLLKQIVHDGIIISLQQLLTSYSKYFNIKHKRVGPLFQGRFKSVAIESDEQLIHTARYIFLNPYTSGLVDNIAGYEWSAYFEYFKDVNLKMCNQKILLDCLKSKKYFMEFINDYADYARSLSMIKNQLSD